MHNYEFKLLLQLIKHTMHHKFLQYTFIIASSLLFSTISFSQTEQDVISEANRLEINSREKGY